MFNRSAEINRSLLESARNAVSKACLDTEARAKLEITRQNAIDTGAAKASIYVKTPLSSDYSDRIAEAKAKARKGSKKTKGKKIEVFADVELTNNGFQAEGIVACGVLYGFYIEYGSTRTHVSIPPRPFMTPAAEEVGAAFDEYCLKHLEAILR